MRNRSGKQRCPYMRKEEWKSLGRRKKKARKICGWGITKLGSLERCPWSKTPKNRLHQSAQPPQNESSSSSPLPVWVWRSARILQPPVPPSHFLLDPSTHAPQASRQRARKDLAVRLKKLCCNFQVNFLFLRRLSVFVCELATSKITQP